MNTGFWILLALGLLLIIAAIAVRAVAFLTSEPRVTVDYLAEYNKISKPDGFDHNDNAYELYTKAGDAYVLPSEQVKIILEKWHSDINETQKTILLEWLEINSQCMEYLKEGNKKKFYWVAREVRPDIWEDKDVTKNVNEDKDEDVLTNTEYKFRFSPGSHGAMLFEQRAKVEAMDDRFEDALADLIECWKIGQHCTNPNRLWTEQSFALNIEEQAVEAAFQILDRYNLDVNTLKLWQDSWQKVFDENTYRPGFKTDRLHYYGYAQKYFAYHPKGKGRLAWKMAKEFEEFEDCSYIGKDGKFHQAWKRKKPSPYYYCIFGATSDEFKGIVDYFFEHYEGYFKNCENYAEKTPWYYYYPQQKFQKEIVEWKDRHPLPKRFFFPHLRPDWTFYHRLKAKQDALITVIAILRFKADHDRYPKNLEILRPREGFRYLEKLPQDPFSEGNLVYHWLVDDFELYSVGPDFNDDGGKRNRRFDSFSEKDKGDDVFWPPFRLNRENVKFYPHRNPRPGP